MDEADLHGRRAERRGRRYGAGHQGSGALGTGMSKWTRRRGGVGGERVVGVGGEGGCLVRGGTSVRGSRAGWPQSCRDAVSPAVVLQGVLPRDGQVICRSRSCGEAVSWASDVRGGGPDSRGSTESNPARGGYARGVRLCQGPARR